jgi:transcriptional regulator with XRE-family HTH domain
LLHKQLHLLREKSGLTQKELSSKLGIARTTYAGYELGTSEPDNDTLQKIANFYDVSIDFMFGRENKQWSISDETLKKAMVEFQKLSKDDQEYLVNLMERLPKKIK